MFGFLRYLFGFTPPPSVERSRKGRDFEEALARERAAHAEGDAKARAFCAATTSRELLGIGPSGPVTRDWSAEDIEAIRQAQDGEFVPVPLATIDHAAGPGKHLDGEGCPSCDESAGDHNADPRGDDDLRIGIGLGPGHVRIPAQSWMAAEPDRIVPL